MCLEIAKVTSAMLSNNRLESGVEDNEVNDLQIDCRGHPINQNKDTQKGGEEAYGDYDNLILVGVWLAVKENG